MPIQTDLNVSPYFDDFSANNRYYRVLFKPSMAVQARELTQVQDILQDQVEKFSNWAFQNGDIVTGCAIADIPNLPYVRLSDFQANSLAYGIANIVGTIVTGSVSDLQARVIASNTGLQLNYPNTSIAYLQYLNSGNTGAQQFTANDQLTFISVTPAGNTTIAVVNAYPNSTSNTFTTGNAHGIQVSSGVVFINGQFVNVLNPTIGLVNTFYTDAGNNVVGFQGVESIVTYNQDPTLLDNALGYENQNAPGADRLKIVPTLVSLNPTTAANTVGFNPIAVYNQGALILKTTAKDLQSQIGSAIAQNIYDEAGNYVVSPFTVDTISKTGNATFMQARVGPGLGYAQGYRVNLLKTAYVDVRRGTDTALLREQQITANYGGYVQLNEVAGNFNFDQYQTVYLYDTASSTVTNHVWGSATPSGNLIGTAQLRSFDYSSGFPGSNTAVYNAYLFNIQMNSGYSFHQTNSMYCNSGSVGIGNVLTAPQQAQASRLFWGFGASGLFTLADTSNSINSEYTFRTSKAATLETDGTIALTIATSAAGGTDELPLGTGDYFFSAATQDIVIIPQSNAVTAALSGNVSVNTTSNAVIGSGTSFTTDFAPTEVIQIGSDLRIVTSVANSTYMTLDNPVGTVNAAADYYKFVPEGYYVPLGTSFPGSRHITVSSSTVMTIYTGLNVTAPVSVTVYYNVLRTTVHPAAKKINKNRFVKIDTRGNPTGPWCLGIADVHTLAGVWGSASNTYATSGADLSGNFLIDTGQRDDYYGLAYIYPLPGTSPSGTPYLTVQLDYFTANTTNGLGFFTVDSYPIDDVNLANTTGITTDELPLYVAGDGTRVPLRDVVDFRPIAINSANNTGQCNTANGTQVNTAIGYASYNPSSNLTLFVPGSGSHIPSPITNFQSDFQRYLPRKDMLFFAPNGALKIKEGVPSSAPQSPLSPDNGMPIAVLTIPAFPSLTSDEMDTLSAENKTALSVIRDTSNPVLVQLLTNRRYTMSDIGKLDQRITNLETYMALTLLEQQATQLTIVNSQGQNAFKNGIFADPFNSYALSDVSNPEYHIALDTINGIARPYIGQEWVPTTYNSANSSQTEKTGRAITLPYAEVTLLSQPYATEYRSAAGLSYRWNGTMTLHPTYNNSVDTINTGSVQATIDTASGLQQLAASPFGTIYGSWNTTNTSNTVVTVTVSGSAGPPINVQLNQGLFNLANPQDPNNYNWVKIAAAEQGIALPANFVIGQALVAVSP